MSEPERDPEKKTARLKAAPEMPDYDAAHTPPVITPDAPPLGDAILAASPDSAVPDAGLVDAKSAERALARASFQIADLEFSPVSKISSVLIAG